MSIDLPQAVAETLAELPDITVRTVEAEPHLYGRTLDLAILGAVKGRPVRFLIEAKTSGYPFDVRQAIWQLAELRHLDQPVADVPLLIAPAICMASRELLRPAWGCVLGHRWQPLHRSPLGLLLGRPAHAGGTAARPA